MQMEAYGLGGAPREVHPGIAVLACLRGRKTGAYHFRLSWEDNPLFAILKYSSVTSIPVIAPENFHRDCRRYAKSLVAEDI